MASLFVGDDARVTTPVLLGRRTWRAAVVAASAVLLAGCGDTSAVVGTAISALEDVVPAGDPLYAPVCAELTPQCVAQMGGRTGAFQDRTDRLEQGEAAFVAELSRGPLGASVLRAPPQFRARRLHSVSRSKNAAASRRMCASRLATGLWLA